MAAAEANHPERIDVVAIVTPNDTHYAITKTFLAAGIHVMCDKPMTTTLDDAVKLATEVERSGLIFALTHAYSGYPVVRQMRHIVQSGGNGKIRMISMEYVQGWLATALEKSGSKQAEVAHRSRTEWTGGVSRRYCYPCLSRCVFCKRTYAREDLLRTHHLCS
jgi:predicted dehydrogenase